jgi:hypothetical protein
MNNKQVDKRKINAEHDTVSQLNLLITDPVQSGRNHCFYLQSTLVDSRNALV